MTIVSQTLIDGISIIVVKVMVSGSAELVKATLFDASSFSAADTDNKLMSIKYSLNGFSATLFWDGSTDLEFFTIPADENHEFNFDMEGGLINNAGTPTGDILISTNGLASGDLGFIELEIRNKTAIAHS